MRTPVRAQRRWQALISVTHHTSCVQEKLDLAFSRTKLRSGRIERNLLREDGPAQAVGNLMLLCSTALLVRLPVGEDSGRDIDVIDHLHPGCNGTNCLLGELFVVEASNLSAELKLVRTSIDTKLSEFADGAIR